MRRRILETSDEIIQDKICRFLEINFHKTAIFEDTRAKKVWHITNSKTPKNYNFFSEFSKEIQAIEHSKEEYDRVRNEHKKIKPNIFIGGNFIAAGVDIDEAIQSLKMLGRRRDESLFEVEEFDGIWIAYD